MKAYKIDLSMYEGKVREVISEAVQRKAFDLGYAWRVGGKKISYQYSAWLDFWSDGDITQCGNDAKCNGHKLVSAADFLALTTAKDEPTFKPFDKVLVRDDHKDEWRAVDFSHMRKDRLYQYCACGQIWQQCIPYEGNEHLLGTTEEAK